MKNNDYDFQIYYSEVEKNYLANVTGFFGECYKDLKIVLKNYENLTPHLLCAATNESKMIVYIGELRHQLRGGGAGACSGTDTE